MRIEHIAIWVRDLESMKIFYEKYFGARSGKKYHNPKKNFTSYFLSFKGGSRLELMHKSDIDQFKNRNDSYGIVHFAMTVGSQSKVDRMTDRLRNDDYEIVGEPRTTGDGYYESVALDPEGNQIEITI